MRRRVLFLVIILGLVLPITGDATLSPDYSVDTNLEPRNYYAVYLTGLLEGDMISINIEETTGGGIRIYIFDRENYLIFSNERHEILEYLERYTNCVSLDTTITVPESGPWYVVFYNSADDSSKHVEGTVTPVSIGLQVLIVVAVFTIVGVSFLCYACRKNTDERKKLKQKRGQPYPKQPAQPPQHRPTPQQEESFRFCPYCGTPRQTSDVKFCAKCGKSFHG